MKKIYTTILIGLAGYGIAQSDEPIYNSWQLNEDDTKSVQINYDDGLGTITDTSELTIKARVQRICYSDDTIFVKSQGLPDNA